MLFHAWYIAGLYGMRATRDMSYSGVPPSLWDAGLSIRQRLCVSLYLTEVSTWASYFLLSLSCSVSVTSSKEDSFPAEGRVVEVQHLPMSEGNDHCWLGLRD